MSLGVEMDVVIVVAAAGGAVAGVSKLTSDECCFYQTDERFSVWKSQVMVSSLESAARG